MRVRISLFIAALLFVVSCKEKPNKKEENQDTSIQTEENATTPTEEETATENTDDSTVQKVKLTTEYGDMIIKLYNETPQHRDNFIKLVEKGFYDDLLFHRVIEGFMIQGGDPESKGASSDKMLGNGGPGYTIPAEFSSKLIHKKGALAAARMGDQMNPAKESSGSQFYIVQGNIYPPAGLQQLSQQTRVGYTQEQVNTYATVGGTPQLDMQYTVFGEVVEGLDVIDKIAAQPVNQQFGNRPIKDIKFKIELVENK